MYTNRLLLFLAFVYFCLLVEAIGSCGNGGFQLSFFGRKQKDERWNTTYRLESSSCNSTKNWNLIVNKNVTNRGNVQHISLHGYFADSESDSLENGALSDTAAQNGPRDHTVADNDAVDKSNGKCTDTLGDLTLKIVSRDDWNAKMSNKSSAALNHPIKKIWIYFKNEYNCSTHKDCSAAMLKVQKEGIATYGYILDNFAAAGDGRIYEGLGWDKSHDDWLRLKYLADPPSLQNRASFALLLRDGIRTGKISKDYSLQGGRADVTKAWLDLFKDA